MTSIDTYYDMLQLIHEDLQPGLYLEIGVHEGHSLGLTQRETRSVGVDPEPKIDFLPGNTTVVAATSDDFFARPDIDSVLGGPIDLTFVDGLHHYQQTLRDIANAERHSSADGVILVHDCLPIDEVTSSPERTTLIWSGDVWKAIVALLRHRPDLTINTIDIAPTGLGVITGLDPTNTELFDDFDRIVDDVASLTFDDLMSEGLAEMLSVVTAEWGTVSELLHPRSTV